MSSLWKENNENKMKLEQLQNEQEEESTVDEMKDKVRLLEEQLKIKEEEIRSERRDKEKLKEEKAYLNEQVEIFRCEVEEIKKQENVAADKMMNMK